MVGCNPQRTFMADEELTFPLRAKWKTRIKADMGSPVIDEHNIYCMKIVTWPVKEPRGLMALDRKSGKLVWELPLDEHYDITPWKRPSAHSVEGDLLLVEDRLFAVGGTHLHCIDAKTGAIVWKVRHHEFGVATCDILNGLNWHEGVLYVNGDENICALNPDDGALLWSKNFGWLCRPTFYRERLYFANVGLEEKNRLYCLDLKTGELTWNVDIAKPGEFYRLDDGRTLFGGGGNRRYISIVEGRIYMSLSHHIACFDAETGEFYWRAENVFCRFPVSDGKRVYGFAGHELHCYDAATGEKLYETERVPQGGSKDPGIPLIVGDKIIIGAVGALYVFDCATGERVWEYFNKKKHGGFVSQPALVDGCLYAPDSYGHFYCFVSKNPTS